MAKIIEQISPTSWSITEEIGPTTTTYMVYDEDPNIDKYTHDFKRLSQSDIDAIKESLNIRGGGSSADDMLSSFELAAQDREFAEKFRSFINMIMGS